MARVLAVYQLRLRQPAWRLRYWLAHLDDTDRNIIRRSFGQSSNDDDSKQL